MAVLKLRVQRSQLGEMSLQGKFARLAERLGRQPKRGAAMSDASSSSTQTRPRLTESILRREKAAPQIAQQAAWGGAIDEARRSARSGGFNAYADGKRRLRIDFPQPRRAP